MTKWFDKFQSLGDDLLVDYQEYGLNAEGANALIGSVLGDNTEQRKKYLKRFKKLAPNLYEYIKKTDNARRSLVDHIKSAKPDVQTHTAASASTNQPRHIGASSRFQRSTREPAAAAASASSSQATSSVSASAPMCASMMQDIAAVDENSYMSCPRELSMEDFKSRLLGVVQYADSLFPPVAPQKNTNQWCLQVIGTKDSKPYTRAMANGDLKHLIVGSIIKEAKWKLAGDLALTIEAPYIRMRDGSLKYAANVRGTIRPDIVIHEARDEGQNDVHAIFDLKFPCPGGAPEHKYYTDRNTQEPITQTALYQKVLNPTVGVLRVCPLGFYGESGPVLGPNAPEFDNHLESAAARAAHNAAIELTGVEPFSLNPIADAVRQYVAYIRDRLSALSSYINDPLINWPNRFTSALSHQAASQVVAPVAATVPVTASSSSSTTSSSTNNQRLVGSGSVRAKRSRGEGDGRALDEEESQKVSKKMFFESNRQASAKGGAVAYPPTLGAAAASSSTSATAASSSEVPSKFNETEQIDDDMMEALFQAEQRHELDK